MQQGVHDFDQSVFDYFNANNIYPSHLSYEEAKQQSDQWHAEKYHTKEKAQYKTPVTSGEKIGNMYMIEVTEEDQKAEGINMQSCIGDKCIVNENTQIFSLRDANNEPHISIKVSNGKIREIKGKQNQTLDNDNLKKYVPYVTNWIKKHPELEIANLDNLPLSKEDLLFLFKNNRLNYNEAMIIAAKNGHIDIVKLMLEKGTTNYNEAMIIAAKNGHIDIVKLMLEKGTTNYNEAMINAAKNGHIDIVKLMLEKGAKNYDWTMINAAKNGHIDIVKLLLEYGATDYDWTMINAAGNGHIDIVKLMLEKGATDYDWTMINAAKNGHIDIVKLLLEYGATNYDWTMRFASENGHIDIVNLIEDWKNKKQKTSINWYTKIKNAQKKETICFPIGWDNEKCIDVFWNPNKNIIKKIISNSSMIRGFIFQKDNKVLIWNAYEANHSYVKKGLKNSGIEIQDIIPFYSDGYNIIISDTSRYTKWHENPELAQKIKNNQNIQKVFPNNFDISYYNEDIVGDWEKLAQRYEDLPYENYFEIGHEGFYDHTKKEFDCEKIKLWVWNCDKGLKVVDVTNDRTKSHDRSSEFIRNFPSINPKGRFQNCHGERKVSVAIPVGYNMTTDKLKLLINDLKEEFGSDIKIFRG